MAPRFIKPYSKAELKDLLSAQRGRLHYVYWRSHLPTDEFEFKPNYKRIEDHTKINKGALTKAIRNGVILKDAVLARLVPFFSSREFAGVQSKEKWSDVTLAWLSRGEGDVPIWPGDGRPLYRLGPAKPLAGAKNWNQQNGWTEAVQEALSWKSPVAPVPPSAYEIAGKWRAYKVVERMTPELAEAIAKVAWLATSSDDRAEIDTKLGRRGRTTALPPPPATVRT
jgi:hypothetical protein